MEMTKPNPYQFKVGVLYEMSTDANGRPVYREVGPAPTKTHRPLARPAYRQPYKSGPSLAGMGSRLAELERALKGGR